ncbi:hypothetical protein OI18_15765 [Flavihumibacter solisilvae]|uniref:WbqC-like protein n=2 Tax=Flavihumibacter solisilvae TaxID=1349421 RepID=A0A0C1L201_9BACT|nr:hypothetical protein OI18_15765 [Flavihumibacter solisilvae]
MTGVKQDRFKVHLKGLNMSTLIIDLQYFGSVYWYKKVYKYTHVEFSEYEKHRKMGFRNRLWIAGAEGRMNLSVPIVDARNEKQVYKDVRIVPGRWQTEHFRALVSCYNRSPWFEHYRDELAALYEKPVDYLFDWNLACFEWMNEKLDLPVTVDVARLPGNGGQAPENESAPGADGVVNFTDYFHPSNSGNWLHGDENRFRYSQVFEDRVGFLPGLSILDLMFCEGLSGVKRLVGDAR